LKYLKNTKRMALWKVAILDVLLVGVILLAFAFFHHGFLSIRSQWLANHDVTETEPIMVETTQPTTLVTEPSQSATEESTEPTEATEPDTRTEWQKRFEDHFTDEVVITENSYTSPEVSITIDTVVTGEGDTQITYYVADVYIASIENFRTYTAHGEMRVYGREDLTDMLAATAPILCISGDSLTYQQSGFTMRNKEIYFDNHNRNSICVMYEDGSMEVHEGGTYDIEQIKAAGALQVWSFGPILLDENGKALEKYEVSAGLKGVHPRSALGYYEPGHYCLVIVDGRLWHHSVGMTVAELAKVFEDLGCTLAYNLDGGGTAIMAFQGERFNRQSDPGRDLADILYITETGKE